MEGFFIMVFCSHADVFLEFLPKALQVGDVAVNVFLLESIYIILKLDALGYDFCHKLFILEGGNRPGPSTRSNVWGISGGIFDHY